MPQNAALPRELVQTLLPPDKFAEWERRQEVSRAFWRTLNGPAERPLGSDADEWNLFVSENADSPAYLAVQIAEAIEQAEQRGRDEMAACAIAAIVK